MTTGMIYPSNFEQKIGFDEIRDMLKAKCATGHARDKVDAMAFSTDRDEIEGRLDQTMEMAAIMDGDDTFPEGHYCDTRRQLHKVAIEGAWMDENEMFDLRRSLQTIGDIVGFFAHEDKAQAYPALTAMSGGVATFPSIIREIDGIIDKFGNIRDNASTDLARIRHDLENAVAGISRSLNSILRQAKADGLVDKEASPSVRDGRLVIPIAPGMKKKIRGIVHDESATGKTVYIEPTEVVEANNRVRELEREERREIIRILTVFADHLRPSLPELNDAYDYLATIDFTRAKAAMAHDMGAVKPHITGHCLIDWSMARHPLLMLALAKQGKQIVPLDIGLDGNRRILVISGPNAGGKSVCLKTVGILQYMLQCGIPVTMAPDSRAGIFESIFIDIGDEQSIENDLSTYSSHLLNMKVMIRHCDPRSLLLIDEFGGGTEPQIGGAIAEAVLRRFNDNKTFGIITTHYQNLKHFADDHEGVINGAMLYDRQLMKPLFQLRIGNPGSSFAIEIARKTGLPEDVIKEASDIVGSDYVNADKYIQDIIRDRRYWENKRQNIRQREKQMEDIIAAYEKQIEELRSAKREIIERAKEEAAEIIRRSNATIENTISQIKKAQAEREATRQARQQIEQLKADIETRQGDDEREEAIVRKMEQLRRRQERKGKKVKTAQPTSAGAKPAPEQPLAEGDYVKLKGQTGTGRIIALQGKTARVQYGMVEVTVKADRLERATPPDKSRDSQKATSFLTRRTQEEMHDKQLNFSQDIDVRGMRGDEAVQAVTYFIDDAIQVGATRVRILHGTGGGILRTLIRQYLDTVPGVKSYRDEHVQFGGAGITVVELD